MSLFDWLFRARESRHREDCYCIACDDRPYDDETMFKPQEVPAPVAALPPRGHYDPMRNVYPKVYGWQLEAAPAPANMGAGGRGAAAIERLRQIDDQCLVHLAEAIRCTPVRTPHQDELIAVLCRVQADIHAAASDAIMLLEGGKP